MWHPVVYLFSYFDLFFIPPTTLIGRDSTKMISHLFHSITHCFLESIVLDVIYKLPSSHWAGSSICWQSWHVFASSTTSIGSETTRFFNKTDWVHLNTLGSSISEANIQDVVQHAKRKHLHTKHRQNGLCQTGTCFNVLLCLYCSPLQLWVIIML